MAILDMLKFVTTLFFCGHLLACAWYAVGTSDGLTADGAVIPGWVARQGWSTNETYVWCGTRYTASLFIALTDTVGDYANTDAEKIYGLFMHFGYECFFGFLIGTVTSMIMAGRISEQLKTEKIMALREYLRIQKVPVKTRKKIRMYYDHMFKHKTVFEEQDMLDDLPESVRAEIVQRVVSNFLEQCKVVFWGFKRDVVLPLAIAMKRMPCTDGETIIREGDDARELYFVVSGRMMEYAMHETPKEVRLGPIHEGGFCGEAELLLKYDQQSNAKKNAVARRRTVIAETEGDLGFLDFDIIIGVMKSHPPLVFRLRALGNKRKERERRLMSSITAETDTRISKALSAVEDEVDTVETLESHHTVHRLTSAVTNVGASLANGIGKRVHSQHHEAVAAAAKKVDGWITMKLGFGHFERLWCSIEMVPRHGASVVCLKFSLAPHDLPYAVYPEHEFSTGVAVRASTVPNAPLNEVEIISRRGRTKLLHIEGDKLHTDGWVDAVNAAVRASATAKLDGEAPSSGDASSARAAQPEPQQVKPLDSTTAAAASPVPEPAAAPVPLAGSPKQEQRSRPRSPIRHHSPPRRP